MSKLSNIIISRTDSIGDVVLTLPMAAVLKEHYPKIKVAFMGKAYTRPVIEACKYVDEFIDVNDFLTKRITVKGEKPAAIIHVLPKPDLAKRAKQLKIPVRIGTRNRLYHWLTCNKLVKLSRKNSELHEAQLNIILLSPLGITKEYSRAEIGHLYGLEKIETLDSEFASLIKNDRYNLILHPKSQGNGREWPIEKFIELVKMLDKKQFNIFVSGTEKERKKLATLFDTVGDDVTDMTGKMSLAQFISFINKCDGLLASGTGPVHIAAALGKNALGLYPPLRPVHLGRWEPLGPHTKVFVTNRECHKCTNPSACLCMQEIQANGVEKAIENFASQKLVRL